MQMFSKITNIFGLYIDTINNLYIIDKFKLFFGVNGNKSEESIKEIPLSDVSFNTNYSDDFS